MKEKEKEKEKGKGKGKGKEKEKANHELPQEIKRTKALSASLYSLGGPFGGKTERDGGKETENRKRVNLLTVVIRPPYTRNSIFGFFFVLARGILVCWFSY